MSSNLEPGELRLLEAAASPQAWNRALATIMEARRGCLPLDWGIKVFDSGLFRRVSTTWEVRPRSSASGKLGRFDVASARVSFDRTQFAAFTNWPVAS